MARYVCDALAAILVGVLPLSAADRRHYRTVRWPAGEVFDGMRG